MRTQCNQESFQFHPLARRRVQGRFDGGAITSDAGGLLLREVEKRTGIIQQFAACFTDHRDPERIEHTVRELVAQRVYALALGYEDLNDHDQLRHDPLLAVLAEKPDPSGESRVRERDQGKALAGKSTLNRLELTGEVVSEEERYKKIALEEAAVDRMLVEVFLEAHELAPAEIILDLDATDDAVHGNQEGRFFHGYYGHYCYLPLYIFCGEHLLCARLRPSNIDASAGGLEEVERIVAEIRQAWPEVKITLRGDSGFCREELMRTEPGGLRAGAGEERTAESGDRPGARTSGRAVCRDRAGGASLQGVHLSNAPELVAGASGGRQGRTPGEGLESPLCGDLAFARSLGSATAL